MITPEMFQIMDWSQFKRRGYYAQLHRARIEMADLLEFLVPAQRPGGHLDFAVRDRDREFLMVLIRPDIPDTRPKYPHRALDLVEYLIEWAAGIRNHHAADIAEMEARYPELSKMKRSELMPAKMRVGNRPLWNWLKRAYKSIF